MNLLRRTREIDFREPRLLDSRTPGVPFQMTGSVWWKPRRARHPDIEAAVRRAVTQQAQAIVLTRDTDDICGAQDAINANLGSDRLERSPCYSRLIPKVTLRLSKQAMVDALEYNRRSRGQL
jgi:hypothetical protein